MFSRDQAEMVYKYLISNKGDFDRTQGRISEEFKMNRPTTTKTMKFLIDEGKIEMKRMGTFNVYHPKQEGEEQ